MTANKPRTRRVKPKAIVIFIIILIFIAFLLVPIIENARDKKLSKKASDVTVVTEGLSREDIAKIVKEELEAEKATTSYFEETEVSATTVPVVEPQVVTTTVTETEVSATTVPVIEPQVVTTTVPETEVEAETEAEDYISFIQNSNTYNVLSMSNTYMAAFYATFIEDTGRDISVIIPEDVNSIYVSVSFKDDNGNMTKLTNYSELEITSNENGSTASYVIPDNPYRAYSIGNMNFTAVFKLKTTEGSSRYFAISY